MQDLIIAFSAVTAISAVGFMAVSFVWLRRLRETVSLALSEAANQQVRTAQRLGDALAQVQKQQGTYDQQLQSLAQASLRLRQELVNVTNRLEHSQSEAMRGDHTVH
jgi:chromosome segregation ATPase